MELGKRKECQNGCFRQRAEQFLARNAARWIPISIEDTSILGHAIGKLIVESFDRGTPVKYVCLYGGCNIGKSTLANNILSGFRNVQGWQIRRRTICQKIAETFPSCVCIDYWMHWMQTRARHIEAYRKPASLKENEILVAEWCDMVPETFFGKDRIDIEMLAARHQFDAINKKEYLFFQETDERKLKPLPAEMFRIVTAVGYGNGKWLEQRLRWRGELNQLRLEF